MVKRTRPSDVVQRLATRIDSMLETVKNRSMTIDVFTDVMAQMQEAAERAAKGVRDAEAAKLACKNMDRISEQILRRHGVLDIGVSAIREHRDA